MGLLEAGRSSASPDASICQARPVRIRQLLGLEIFHDSHVATMAFCLTILSNSPWEHLVS